MFETILFEKKDGVAGITLNRPKVLNALSPQLIDEMRAALREIEQDWDIKVVVLRAAGRAFCAGGDLASIKGMLGSTHKFELYIRSVHEAFNALERLSKPVICAVHGLAFAGGLELTLACDFVIASEEAQFGDTHGKFGLIPGGGATQRLSRMIGIRKAKELLMTSDLLSAREAEALGLVNKVVPAARLEEAVREMVRKISENKSPLVVKRVKELVNKGIQCDLHTALEMEISMVVYHAGSHDMAEGIRAFETRTAPVYKGK